MLRYLSLAFCMVVLLATFGFAANKYTGLSTDTLKIYYGTGNDYWGVWDGVHVFHDDMYAYNFAGTFLASSPLLPLNGNVHAEHGMSITNDGLNILTATGVETHGNDGWYSWGAWWHYINPSTGQINSNWEPRYEKYPGVVGFNPYNNWFEIHSEAVAHDWETDKAYFMGRGVSDGILNLWRLDDNGIGDQVTPGNSETVRQSYIMAVAQFPGIHANPWGYITVNDGYVYGTCGYVDPGGVYRIDKNFADQASITWFIDANDGKYFYNYFYGLTDWRGLCFDEAGNLYVTYQAGGTFVAKFKPNGDVINDQLIVVTAATDLKYAAGYLFLATGSGVQVYDTDGNYFSTISSGSIRTLDVTGPRTAPTTVKLTATVNLLGWKGAMPTNVDVTVGAGSAVSTPLSFFDVDTGTFELPLAQNSTISVKVKGAKTVSETKSIVTVTSDVVQTFNLQCGNNNGDNKIDDLDFLKVINNFGSLINGAVGDGNGDGKTDDLDFLLVINNFGKTGT